MLHRRIAYGAALLLALLLLLCSTGYAALFLLFLLLVLPLLSLVLSLPAVLGSVLSLTHTPTSPIRGGESSWTLSCSSRSPFPLTRFRARVVLESPFSAQRMVRRVDIREGERVWTQGVPSEHCGAWTCTVHRPRLCDFLGLFSLPLPAPKPDTLSVFPTPREAGPVPQLTWEGGQSVQWKVRPGGGNTEDYDLREYRPGDPMRLVHWKLSSKREELVVKEMLEPCRPTLLLTFDHFGTPEELDAVLERLLAISRLLLSQNTPHIIQWAHPVSGAVERCPVADAAALTEALQRILCQPAPLQGRSILDTAAPHPAGDGTPRRLHVTPALWQEGGWP